MCLRSPALASVFFTSSATCRNLGERGIEWQKKFVGHTLDKRLWQCAFIYSQDCELLEGLTGLQFHLESIAAPKETYTASTAVGQAHFPNTVESPE